MSISFKGEADSSFTRRERLLRAAPDPSNAALFQAVKNAATWFDAERAAVVGHAVYRLARPGVVLSVFARCPGHLLDDGTVEECGRLFYGRKLYMPGALPNRHEVRTEMIRQAALLRRWITAAEPHAVDCRPTELDGGEAQ